MTISPEVNDVDISKLFEWSTLVDLYDIEGEPKTTVFLRLIGDADVNRARIAALRGSAELRKKLKDKTSDEYSALLPDISTAEKKNLVELLLLLKISEYTDKVIKNINIPFPKKPKSDATLEKKEEYQLEVDGYDDKRQAAIRKAIEKEISLDRLRLNKITKSKLLTQYSDTLVNNLCEAEMTSTFVGHSIYYGTFNDEDFTIKSFKSFDNYNNTQTYVKSQLIKAYTDLQLGIVNLKK